MPKSHIHQEKVLNPEQEQAIHFGKGPLLIIAGAGTGKTTVVTERIKYLITAGLAQPSEILALTFTEKAAREMEERVDVVMPYGYTQMWISTFHSFCDRVLRQDAVHIGLNPGYKLLSDTDVTMLLRKHIFTLGLEYFRPLGNPTKFVSGLITHFSRLSDEDITPSQYEDWIKVQSSKLKVKNKEGESELKQWKELANAYVKYEEIKVAEGFMDFANLIGNTLKLFRQRPNILKKYQEQFQFILVDEFQDTNVAQNELVRLLVGKQQNITAVADDDQSIYKFRGAAVSNVLSFRKHFPKVQLIVLSKNYRSTQAILDNAYRLIQHNNPDRLEVKEGINKKLHAMRELVGEGIGFMRYERVEDEAEGVVKEIQNLKLKSKHLNWNDIAILVRANAHAEPFVRAFTRAGVPFQFLGPGQLFKQPEIKELICYLQLLTNFEDNISFLKLLSIPYFTIAGRDIAQLVNFSRKSLVSLFEAAEIVAGLKKALPSMRVPFISEETKQRLTQFITMINKHLALMRSDTAGQILFYFLEETGILKSILENKFPIDEAKAANITTFFGKLKTYEAEHEDASVPVVLDWLLLSMELGESPLASNTDWTGNDAVNILTVHSAKGLEFSVVFLVNLVSQRFPSTQRHEMIPIPEELIKEALPEGDFHEEEERRLFYVGMTRARDQLYFTAANFYGEGRRERKVSPFVYEALGDGASPLFAPQTISQLSLLDWRKKSQLTTVQVKSNIAVTYLSYTQIETFRMCPLHYRLRYILNIPATPSPAMSFGTSVHATLKEFYQLVQQGVSVSSKTLLELLDKNWLLDGYTSREYERQMRERGRIYMEQFFTNFYDKSAHPLLLEQPFTVPIALNGKILKIGGRIDRIDDGGDGTIEIIDYKTGKTPSKRELDTSLQLTMYALAATEVREPPFNKQPKQIKLTYYFFDEGKKVTTTRTREQLEAEKAKIMAIAQEIEQSDFKCSHGPFCNACEYRMFCGVE